jgi:F0F1-type ATP synthase assembly protein I
MPALPYQPPRQPPENGRSLLYELPCQTHTEGIMKRNVVAMVGDYMALAFLLPTATFVGYVIGYLLDKALGTNFLYIVFLVLGIVSGFVQLIRRLMRDTRGNGS